MTPFVELAERRILVTGARGFIGRHVMDRLHGHANVFHLTRPRSGEETDGCVLGDLADPRSLQKAMEQARPTHVIHLAGATPPGEPSHFYQVNTLGTLNLLDALRGLGTQVRVVVTGSAAELGPVEGYDLPVAEGYQARPADGYGLSKLLATTAALVSQFPLEVMVARVFNPIGPGIPESQALGRFASILVRARESSVELTVGDLTPKRDFVDVRDVADALLSILVGGVPGRLYHVGTGRSHSIAEGLAMLSELSGREVRTRFDASLAGRTGPRDSRADVSRLHSELGWFPSFTWEQSISDLWSDAVLRLTAPATLV